jgi:hypothetical protein
VHDGEPAARRYSRKRSDGRRTGKGRARPPKTAVRIVSFVAPFAALVVAAATTGVAASVPTRAECLEASQFIANAAHARDNGMRRDAFVARIEADFVVIRAFPAELRWFAKDVDDERFLVEAAAEVFDRPRAADRHRSDFLADCLARAARG